MSFADFEEGRATGNPVELYLFRYGTEAGEYYAYTNYTEELTIDHGGAIGEITYSPVPIAREAINANGTLDRSDLKITADIGTDLAEIFRVYPPASVVTVIMHPGHIGDPDSEFLVGWAGRVTEAERKGSRLELTCEPVSTSMRRPGLRRNYQIGCPHQLYGPQCLADKPSKTVASTIAAIDGATVTLASGWEGAFAPAKFLGGLLEWEAAGGSTDRRTILRIAGDVLSLSGIPQGLAISDPVDVVLGCNHQPFTSGGGDCQGLHDNILNYGGDPFIPLVNPIGTFNNYY